MAIQWYRKSKPAGVNTLPGSPDTKPEDKQKTPVNTDKKTNPPKVNKSGKNGKADNTAKAAAAKTTVPAKDAGNEQKGDK